MSGLDESFSTSTACMFMATSKRPSEAPKKNKVIAKLGGVFIIVSKGRHKESPIPPVKIIGFAPNREASIPVVIMANSEPIPRHSNKRPRWPSSIANLILTNGTNGAQHAIPNPATRKAIRVDNRLAGRCSLYVLVTVFTPPNNHDFASSLCCSRTRNHAK